MIPIVGLRERREFIVRSPIETTPINYDAAKGNPMTAQELSHRMHDDVVPNSIGLIKYGVVKVASTMSGMP